MVPFTCRSAFPYLFSFPISTASSTSLSKNTTTKYAVAPVENSVLFPPSYCCVQMHKMQGGARADETFSSKLFDHKLLRLPPLLPRSHILNRRSIFSEMEEKGALIGQALHWHLPHVLANWTGALPIFLISSWDDEWVFLNVKIFKLKELFFSLSHFTCVFNRLSLGIFLKEDDRASEKKSSKFPWVDA